jgi:hypothetical protein
MLGLQILEESVHSKWVVHSPSWGYVLTMFKWSEVVPDLYIMEANANPAYANTLATMFWQLKKSHWKIHNQHQVAACVLSCLLLPLGIRWDNDIYGFSLQDCAALLQERKLRQSTSTASWRPWLKRWDQKISRPGYQEASSMPLTLIHRVLHDSNESSIKTHSFTFLLFHNIFFIGKRKL